VTEWLPGVIPLTGTDHVPSVATMDVRGVLEPSMKTLTM